MSSKDQNFNDVNVNNEQIDSIEEVTTDEEAEDNFVGKKIKVKPKKVSNKEKQKEKGKQEAKKLEKQRKVNSKRFAVKIKKIGILFMCNVCKFVTKVKLCAKMHSLKKCERKMASVSLKRKIVSCSLCDEVFDSHVKKNKHHMNIHEKRLVCSKCPGKSWKTWTTWSKHLQEVHGARKSRFSCSRCDFKTARKANLARHRISAHRKVLPRDPVQAGAESEEPGSLGQGQVSSASVLQYLGEGRVLLYLGGRKLHLLRLVAGKKQELRKIQTVILPFAIRNVSVSSSGNQFAMISDCSKKILVYMVEEKLMRELPSILVPPTLFNIAWLHDSKMMMVYNNSCLQLFQIEDEDNIAQLASLRIEHLHLDIVDVTFIKYKVKFQMLAVTDQGFVISFDISGGNIRIVQEKVQVRNYNLMHLYL